MAKLAEAATATVTANGICETPIRLVFWIAIGNFKAVAAELVLINAPSSPCQLTTTSRPVELLRHFPNDEYGLDLGFAQVGFD